MTADAIRARASAIAVSIQTTRLRPAGAHDAAACERLELAAIDLAHAAMRAADAADRLGAAPALAALALAALEHLAAEVAALTGREAA